MELTEAREALRGLGEAAGGERPGRVRLSLEGAVARLVLDNPGARGAFTFRMMVDLADAVAQLSSWDGAVVLVSSTDPRAFCAGGHLGEVRRAVTDGGAAAVMAEAMGCVLDALWDLPQVSIAVLDGPAIGGGAELSTACDLRVMGPGGRIHFVHGQLGIAPGWGAAARLVALLGRRAALRVLLEGRRLGPQEALALGLADRVGQTAAGEAEGWAGELTQLAPEAVRAIKGQVAGGDAVAAFASVWGGEAHRAALAKLGKHG